MQRKKLFILYAILSSLIFTGVSVSSPVHAAQTNDSKAITTVYNDVKENQQDIYIYIIKATVKKHTQKYTYKNKNKKVVMEAVYNRPVLKGDLNSLKKINKFYEKQEKEWLSSFKEYLDDAKEFSEGGNFPIYNDNVSYKVTYNQKGYLSIVTSGYLYTGGAHGTPYTDAHTFDLNTGKELKLTDIMKGSDKTIKNKIYKAFEKKIKANKEEYFSDALKTVNKTAGKNSYFYLKKGKICFYYDVYALAPYAAGQIEASIPFTSKDTFKIVF